MEAFFASGRAVDLILLVLLAEFVWLVTRGGWRAGDAALRLLPGALILLALRATLTGAGWRWTALMLALSLPAHLADVALGPRRR